MNDDHHDRPEAAPPKGPPPDGPALIGSVARRRIGRDLRLLYRSVLDQPLPERFTRLIDELAADDSGNRKGS